MKSFFTLHRRCFPLSLLALTGAALTGTAQAVTIEGRLGNASQVRQTVGDSNVRVLLANFTEGRLVGVSTLSDGLFTLSVPQDFQPKTAPMNVCPGVKATPSEPRIYTAETLLVYHAGRNQAAMLMQADSPTDPTRRTQWVYSDRAATLRGQCTGLNTHYDLKLRQGWTPIMTVSQSGNFKVTNATPGLPYWVQGGFMSNARQTFKTLLGSKS